MFHVLKKPFGKKAMEQKVRDALGIKALPISTGGSTSSKLTYQILEKFNKDIVPATESSQRVTQIMSHLGLQADDWDFSKGSTVPCRGLSKIHRAITGQPRLFLYKIDKDVALGETLSLLVDSPKQDAPLPVAGPGALVWLVNNASETVVPFAEVEKVNALSPDGNKKIAPWEVHVRVRGFSTSIQSASMRRAMKSTQIGAHREFVWDAQVGRSGLDFAPVSSSTSSTLINESSVPSIPKCPESLGETPITFHFKDALVRQIRQRDRFSPNREPSTDRKGKVEKAAIDFASKLMTSNGWCLEVDRQQDRGFGYDLEYVKDGQVIYLEVKGVSGTGLDFNMTANELLAASTLDGWATLVVHVGMDLTPFQYEWHWGKTLLSEKSTAIVPTQLHVSFAGGDKLHNFAK